MSGCLCRVCGIQVDVVFDGKPDGQVVTVCDKHKGAFKRDPRAGQVREVTGRVTKGAVSR